MELTVHYNNSPCYKIFIEKGFGLFCNRLTESVAKKYNKVCIVSDSKVAELYLDSFTNSIKSSFDTVISFVFPFGEASKTLNTVEDLYEELIKAHFDRGDLLIALGGGVVGDLTGFTAATYLRGIDFIQVPTTLLSQSDSSVGGKTGVDFRGYKNMVGAFHMPKMVYMNIETLHTLGSEIFACGMGEVVKHGLIKDIEFYQWLKDNAKDIKALSDDDKLMYMVYKNVDIKRMVVEEDPTEKGIRGHLNFGHTIGHAIEKLSDFKLYHGQCVSIGMVAALYLSVRDGYVTEEQFEDIKNTLTMFDLPLYTSGIDAKEVLATTKSDKKMVGSKVKFIYLNRVGNAEITKEYTDEDLLEAINYVIR